MRHSGCLRWRDWFSSFCFSPTEQRMGHSCNRSAECHRRVAPQITVSLVDCSHLLCGECARLLAPALEPVRMPFPGHSPVASLDLCLRTVCTHAQQFACTLVL